MKKYILIILFLGIYSISYATHNRAGQIIYEQIGPLKYKIIIETFTYIGPGIVADRDELEILFGDNTSGIAPRIDKRTLPDFYQYNMYVIEHTFPGPGTYELVMEDPNRNAGINNIPSSVNVLFTLRTTLQINPLVGENSTPKLLNPPTDKAVVNVPFIHNPNAWDPDGDSISYKLTECLGEDGLPIVNYSYPPSTNIPIYVDEITGDLIWDSPPIVGRYNVAVAIEEWRNGVKIGEIIRDMQIDVTETDNRPPVITPVNDTCLLAGEYLQFDVTATDPDPNTVLALSATGGPFEVVVSSATFPRITANGGTATGTFRWQTVCEHVAKYPYRVVFKAEDNHEIKLSDYESMAIKVVGPAPDTVILSPTNNSIFVQWNKTDYGCQNAEGYHIYRKRQYYGFQPDHCETGVPAYTGYERIASVEGVDITTFLDNNDGQGLEQGFMYCYMITAYYPDGAESYASMEICEDLTRGIPILTMNTVVETNETEGIIDLDWAKPVEIDLEQTPGPFRYSIYPSKDFWCLLKTDPFYNEGLDDTTLTVNTLDTKFIPNSFLIGLYSFNDTTQRYDILMGPPSCASSVFLDFYASDNQLQLIFNKNVPWINEQYVVYRQNKTTLEFDSVGFTEEEFYLDNGLINGEEYCYKVKSIGGYTIEGVKNPIVNWSQINCGIPVDTIPPCLPKLEVTSYCDDIFNELIWTNPNNYCANDVVYYNIYYSPTLQNTFGDSIASTLSATDTVFYHYPKQYEGQNMTLSGCYTVTAVDSFYNESKIVSRVCVDNCIYYKLPNVFSPDNDGVNDLFQPFPYDFVEKVDMKIYNRWGELVFETNNPDILWNGKYLETNNDVPDGVYYYLCDVYEQRLTGVLPRNISGFIHIFRGTGQKP